MSGPIFPGPSDRNAQDAASQQPDIPEEWLQDGRQPGGTDAWGRPQDAVPGQPAGERTSSGGMFPIPHQTWRRGNSSITVGGCCLPLPIGCLTVVGAAAIAGIAAVRGRA